MQSENEVYREALCGHLNQMTQRLRLLPPDKWDFTFHVAAPTPRTIAAHAWQWLACDRQHILEPDVARHALIPEPPADPIAMCDALARETEAWEALLRDLTPEQMAEPRRQFGEGPPLNVRWFIFHILQHCIMKNGQLGYVFFALGLDGVEPYAAPFPNPIYEEIGVGQPPDLG
ncbi:MAG TPA: DinB family protein [Armatimonadota bacterium]|jgi:hypothetical protein